MKSSIHQCFSYADSVNLLTYCQMHVFYEPGLQPVLDKAARALLPFHIHFARADLSAASLLTVCWCCAKPSGRRLPLLLIYEAS